MESAKTRKTLPQTTIPSVEPTKARHVSGVSTGIAAQGHLVTKPQVAYRATTTATATTAVAERSHLRVLAYRVRSV